MTKHTLEFSKLRGHNHRQKIAIKTLQLDFIPRVGEGVHIDNTWYEVQAVYHVCTGPDSPRHLIDVMPY